MTEAHLVCVTGYTENPVPEQCFKMENVNNATTNVFEAWAYCSC